MKLSVSPLICKLQISKEEEEKRILMVRMLRALFNIKCMMLLVKKSYTEHEAKSYIYRYASVNKSTYVLHNDSDYIPSALSIQPPSASQSSAFSLRP